MSAFTELLKCLCLLWNPSNKVTKADFNTMVGPFSDNKKSEVLFRLRLMIKNQIIINIKIIILSCFVLTSLCANAQNQRDVCFDKSWRFTKDSVSNAEQVAFDDAKWRTVDLPHDWSIEDLPNQSLDGNVLGPFSKNAVGKGTVGYTVGGVGWYRKTFILDKSYDGKQTYITFDGVYMYADIWINGHYLGNHPNGYTSFFYNLSDFLNPVGKSNVIVVKVKNTGKNSRWYSGSGIYRHVWLTKMNKVHTEIWGNYITTPIVSGNSAQVNVQTAIQNSGLQTKTIDVTVNVINPSGQIVSSTNKSIAIAAHGKDTASQQVTIPRPSLWTLESPALYKAKVVISSGGKLIDQTITTFGIRSISFDGKRGFLLNGKETKLKGGCIHHDNGPLGAAAFDRAEERKIELLKNAGYNAVRLSHNPMSPALLDACDRLGMLVVTDSFDSWERQKNPQDYHLYFNEWWKNDLNAIILRDRNHPSIIMWGIGNEIYESADTSGHRLAKQLADEAHRIDPTRPVTEAISFYPSFMKNTWEDFEPHLAILDVVGYNYYVGGKHDMLGRDSTFEHRYEIDHAKHPDKAYMATEYFPTAALENWEKAEKYPYVLGGFTWAAMDYIGEAGTGSPHLIADSIKFKRNPGGLSRFFTPNSWPVYTAYSGDLDLIGNRKAASYYQNVVWRNSPVEILVHSPLPAGMQEINSPWGFPDELKSWTWPGQEGKKMQVHVYTRSKKVKLELNGKVIAERLVPDGSITANFEITYQRGTLTAKGYENGIEKGSDSLITTGKPVAIRLISDKKTIKADGSDLSFINVEIVDEKENVVPWVNDLEINYELIGEATIAGIGNGNPADLSSFQQNHKKVFRGKGLIIIRSKGKKEIVTLKASAIGLKSSTINIKLN